MLTDYADPLYCVNAKVILSTLQSLTDLVERQILAMSAKRIHLRNFHCDHAISMIESIWVFLRVDEESDNIDPGRNFHSTRARARMFG